MHSPSSTRERSAKGFGVLRAIGGLLVRAGRLAAAFLVLMGCRHASRQEPPGAHALARQLLAGRIGRPGMAYDIVYRLYVPPAYDPSRRYPLIVFLHGSGANGIDNLRQLGPELGQLIDRTQAQEPVLVLAPQCPEGDKWVSGSRGASFLNYSQKVRAESDASKLVLLLLDDLVWNYSIDPDRIYLTGHSAGAAGTWDIISRHADGRFAAAVPVTGANDPSRANAIVEMPIWTFHGAQDRTSPPENTREMVAALRALGSRVRYTEYPDVGHDTLPHAYSEKDLFRWLLAQRRGHPDAGRSGETPSN